MTPEGERRRRLVIPARLRGTSLYRQLGELLVDEEEGVKLIFGRRGGQHINLSSGK